MPVSLEPVPLFFRIALVILYPAILLNEGKDTNIF